MNDRQLSPHFSVYQLTRTDHVDLQTENRHTTDEEEKKLGEVANLLETCRIVLGCDLDVHSGRRYLELNKRVGGSDRSQHLKCEAADFSPAGPDTEESVNDGREGRKFWVHISLGAPYRNATRCGEVASMTDGKYTAISKIQEAI